MSEADRFYVLDLDRTLIDTTKIFQVLLDSLTGGDIKAELDQDRALVEATGGSFDLGDALTRVVGIERTKELFESFATIADQSEQQFLLPGANQLLTAIEQSNHPIGIVTMGGDLWQKAKLRITGLDRYPYKIVKQKDKGRMIAEWMDASTLPGELGGYAAKLVVLVDDKAASFSGLPLVGARGYCVQSLDAALPTQQGSLPNNVRRVDNLQAVITGEEL